MLTRVLNLEKDLLQMRSALDRGSINQSTERAPGSLNRTLPVSQEGFNRQMLKPFYYYNRFALNKV